MRNFLTRALPVSLLLAGLIGVQGPARAAGPTSASCVISDAAVANYTKPTLQGGVPVYLNSRPKKDYYQFSDTNLVCNGVINGATYTQETFSVTAGGWSTGLVSSAGETCDEGKSEGAGTLTAAGPTTLYARVSFYRVEGTVWAYGPMYSNSAMTTKVANFNAELSFIPWKAGATGPDLDAIQGCFGTDDTKGAHRARMDGVAQITDAAVPVVQPTP